MSAAGRVWKYGNNVDTDAIIPARYLNCSDPAELARHCMSGIDGEFAVGLHRGDIIVAGDNFGCGSSREHAPLAIKEAGVGCVIAKSFARIFYRNAINIGLAILESPLAVEETKVGDTLEFDLTAGTIANLTTNKSYRSVSYPPFMQELLAEGGLVEYTRKRIAAGRLPS